MILQLLHQFLNRYFIILISIFYVLLAFLVRKGAHWDLSAFNEWRIELYNGGLAHLYCDKITDYTPLYLYLLEAFNFIFGSHADRFWYKIKILSIPFSFGIAVIAWWLARKNNRPMYSILLLACNIPLLYVGYIWGQVDDIHSFFLVLCSALLYSKRPAWAVGAFVFAINMKLQAIVFLPVLGLWWLYTVGFSIKKTAQSIATLIGVQFILSVSLIYTQCLDCMLDNVVFTAVNRFTKISVNAYNLWYILVPDLLNTALKNTSPASKSILLDDTRQFILGYSFHQWGLLLFTIMILVLLLPLFYRLFQKNKPNFWTLENGLLGCAITGLLFFYFPTQMHERYSHPAIIFAGLWAITSKNRWRYVLFILLSWCYMVNLEHVFRYFKLSVYDWFIFHPVVTSILYGLVIIFLLLIWYQKTITPPDHLNTKD